MEKKKRYQIRSGYLLREIAGEYAIIPVNEECLISNAVLVPNETAVFFWKFFKTPGTIEEAVSEGLREYEVPEEVIRNAVVSFVYDMLRYRVIEEVE